MTDAPDRDLQAEIERYKEEIRELRGDVRYAESDVEQAKSDKELAENNLATLRARVSAFLDLAIQRHREIATGEYIGDPYVRELAELYGWYLSIECRGTSTRWRW